MANPIFIIDIGPDGIVAAHPARTELPVLVAPVPESRKTKDFNTIRPQLIVLGCMQLPGAGFEFDSSFVSPKSARRFTQFARLMQALQKQDDAPEKRLPPCSVFGHADPTGDDDYNKTLAGRRARAVYGVLTRNKKLWDELYRSPFGGDQWGVRTIRMMLSIPLQKGEPPFYTGPIEPGPEKADKDAVQKQTHNALVAYQQARGKAPSGFPSDETRDKLVEEYMNAICRDPADQAFTLDPEKHFIAKNKDPQKQSKGDVQGCGDFNEIFLLSQDEEDAAKKDKAQEKVRNEQYRADRRVLVYIFKHDTEIDPKHWPCPNSRESSTGCKIRFWSDYPDRRKRTSKRRIFGQNMSLFQRDEGGNLVLDAAGNPTPVKVEETGNTMACRWYHAFAVHSPCERAMQEWIVRIHLDSTKKQTKPLAGRRYVVATGSAEYAAVIRGTTSDLGEIRIPVFDENVMMTVKLDAWGKLFDFDDAKPAGAPGDASKSQEDAKPDSGPGGDEFPDEDKFMTFQLDAGALRHMAAQAGELPSKQRLYNLGYGVNTPDQWTGQELNDAVRQYRQFKELGKDSTLDDATRQALLQDHELSDPGPQPDDTEGGGQSN